MIVPFAAGGAGDILARSLGARLEPRWGKPLVVENKPGAGGVIGAVATAKADPDGYTLMIAPSATMAVNVSLFKALSLRSSHRTSFRSRSRPRRRSCLW